MKTRNQVSMMRCYWMLYIGIFFGSGIAAKVFNTTALNTIPFIVLFISIPVFYFMYRASVEIKGISYARRNLFLGIVLTAIAGFGIFLWPPLINSEINKKRLAQQAAGGDGTR